MMLLCLDVPQPGATLEKYQPHLANETRHAWQMYRGGIIRDIYFRQDHPGVAILAECESVDAAKAALCEFSLARAGVIGWDVILFLFSSQNREIGGLATRIAEAVCAASALCWLLTTGIPLTSFMVENHDSLSAALTPPGADPLYVRSPETPKRYLNPSPVNVQVRHDPPCRRPPPSCAFV